MMIINTIKNNISEHYLSRMYSHRAYIITTIRNLLRDNGIKEIADIYAIDKSIVKAIKDLSSSDCVKLLTHFTHNPKIDASDAFKYISSITSSIVIRDYILRCRTVDNPSNGFVVKIKHSVIIDDKYNQKSFVSTFLIDEFDVRKVKPTCISDQAYLTPDYDLNDNSHILARKSGTAMIDSSRFNCFIQMFNRNDKVIAEKYHFMDKTSDEIRLQTKLGCESVTRLRIWYFDRDFSRDSDHLIFRSHVRDCVHKDLHIVALVGAESDDIKIPLVKNLRMALPFGIATVKK